MSDTEPMRTCPHCAETIRARAKVCPHCGRNVPPVVKPGPKGMTRANWIIILVMVVIAGLVTLLALYATRDQLRPTWRSSQPPASSTRAPATFVTLDGSDPAAGMTIERINLWSDYQTRAKVTGVGLHGQQVELIRREGDGVLVKLASGEQGWVTYYFIREFK